MTNRHLVSYGTFLAVWLGLLVLTATTITVAGLRLGRWSALAAILIAATKSTLVLLYFMHLKYESRLFVFALLLAIVTLAIIMSLTFADIIFR